MTHPRIARREDAFLLVIDVQEPLMKVMPDREGLLKNVEILIESAKALSLPVYATEQYPERFGPTITEISARWGDTHPEGKMAFSSYACNFWVEEVERSGRKQAILCGVETHVCVSQTAHDLLERGYAVHVPADAIASRTALNREWGLDKMRESGAVITSTEMVVYELMGQAGTSEFKALLPLFR